MIWQDNGPKAFLKQYSLSIKVPDSTMPELNTNVSLQKIFVPCNAGLIIFHIIVVNVSNAMNVGIQESDHFEGVYPVIRLFDNGNNQLYIFVNPETKLRLLDLLGQSAGKYIWVVQGEHQSTLAFCRTIRQTVLENNIQLLYLNTISKHHIWYALFIPFNKIKLTILTVHDVNCLFKDKLSLAPRRLIKYLGKNLLVRRVKALNTVSDTVRPYLLTQVKNHQQVFTVPGAVYESKRSVTSHSEMLRIVIPGSIDPKRRDYEQVFYLLDALGNFPVMIILLGGGSGDYAEKIWRKCKASAPFQVKWFEQQMVSQSEFDQYLDQSHFIWVPSVVETTICGSIPETYGITKSSGNIFDIIKHAKPFIYPGSLRIPGILQPSGIGYNSIRELAAVIQYFSAHPAAYLDLANAAIAESGNFTVENLRKTLAPLFD